MATATALDPRSETFYDVKNLLHKIVHKFRRRYGGDYQELFSQASLYYVKAYNTFDPSRGSFTKRIGYNVWMDLLSEKRRQAIAVKNRPAYCWDPDWFECVAEQERRGLNVARLLGTISPDAAFVIKIVLDLPVPPEGDGWRPHKCPSYSHRSLIRFLSGLEWTGQRILESFAEIKEALCS